MEVNRKGKDLGTAMMMITIMISANINLSNANETITIIKPGLLILNPN